MCEQHVNEVVGLADRSQCQQLCVLRLIYWVVEQKRFKQQVEVHQLELLTC